jgi:hypothetical protein
MMKREQFNPGPWDCGSNLYQSLYCTSLIRFYGGSFFIEMIYEMQITSCS